MFLIRCCNWHHFCTEKPKFISEIKRSTRTWTIQIPQIVKTARPQPQNWKTDWPGQAAAQVCWRTYFNDFRVSSFNRFDELEWVRVRLIWRILLVRAIYSHEESFSTMTRSYWKRVRRHVFWRYRSEDRRKSVCDKFERIQALKEPVIFSV